MASDRHFNYVKIGLIVVHGFFLVVLLVCIILSIVSLIGLSQQQFGKIQVQSANFQLKTTLIIMISSLILSLVSLIGVIRENKYLVIAFTIYGCISVVYQMINANLFGLLVELPFPTLMGVYGYLIVQRKADNSPTTTDSFTA
ncbi:uncharacterized protein LOC128964358 [Oppia nitens]|uniref:uncharacterized protein LOC128964358 n=1 Tax=Oppia nitens TaxID=1686743 RepID=UPI0023D9ED16|nr:uncharacterized protein LOC128964358 [Oppia nitens]